MQVLANMEDYGHEQIVHARDEETGLRTIIAIHSTVLGPAVGGTRFWDYPTEEDALYDVLRLSRGMSLKNAAAGLALGGGKAVILGDPKKLKSPAFFQAYGRIIHSLGGRYYTAEDVNTGTDDIDQIRTVTPYVTGTADISGNPSPYTARGVFRGMLAGAGARFGTEDLTGMVVTVQGLGSVGYSLCEILHRQGAVLQVYDIDGEAVQRAVTQLGATQLSPSEVLSTPCDIFAPCALGAVISTENAARLGCKMVCGSANNVLVDAAAGNALEELGILYLPDYIVNAGGIINCGEEITAQRYDAAVVTRKVDEIYDTVRKVIELSRAEGISTSAAADAYALGLIAQKKQQSAARPS